MYFIFVGFNVLVTIPTVYVFFVETNQKSLEQIDLLFGDRALGTLPTEIAERDVNEAIRLESVAREKSVQINQVDLQVEAARTK